MGSGWSAVLAPSAAAPTAELSRRFTSEKRFTFTAELLGEPFMPAKNPGKKLEDKLPLRSWIPHYYYYHCYELLR